jgi:hypothetical protein
MFISRKTCSSTRNGGSIGDRCAGLNPTMPFVRMVNKWTLRRLIGAFEGIRSEVQA